MPKKTLIIVFGEMGMGKTRTAQYIADKTGMVFYEGDLALPAGMELKTPKAVDNFVENFLIPEIRKKLDKHDNLVVPQALYFQKHRTKIWETFKDIADMHFINVTSSEEWQITQLKRRPEPGWLEYAKMSKPYFEQPPKNELYSTVHNNADETAVLKQINSIFKKFSSDKSTPWYTFFSVAPKEEMKIHEEKEMVSAVVQKS